MNSPETVGVGHRPAATGRYGRGMTSRRTIRAAAFVLAAGFAVVACGSSDTAEPAAATEPAVTEPAATQPAVDGSDPAPSSATPELLQFTSPLVGGGEIDAAALAGKPTAFWFWSPT